MNLKPGDNVLVETSTKFFLGELVSIDGPYAVTITNWSWVADTGRLNVFMKNGEAPNMEIEPAPDGVEKTLHWQAIDAWRHELLRKTFPV